MKAASELGAKSLRWGVPWQSIELSEGRFDWSLPDRIVRAAEASKIELVLLVEGYSPDPRKTNFRNLYAAGGDQKLRAYESFLREYVRRYQGRVHYWQIENEVTFPQYWAGSLDDYVSVLSTAYRAIKSEDKGSTVLLAGLAGEAQPAQIRFLLERGRDHFDILDAHFYFPPEDLPGKISGLRTAMKTIGYGKPIWVTETGGPHPCTSPQSAQEPPPERQSSEVVRRYVELLSAGVERVFWFGLQHDTTSIWGCKAELADSMFNFMMLVRGQQRRPAFSTYQLMVQKLDGFTAVERINLGEGISTFRFSVRSGSVVVLWADKDKIVNVAGTAGDVSVTDILGRPSRSSAGAIPVSTSPLFIEMGR